MNDNMVSGGKWQHYMYLCSCEQLF